MIYKTKATCPNCQKKYGASQAGAHLLKCVLHPSSPTEGYLIRISCSAQSSLYWMFVTAPLKTSLDELDIFLRDIWLECCGHLSEFIIEGRSYISHTEAGNPSRCMQKQIGQLLMPGSTCNYIYDFGTSTELEILVLAKIDIGQQKKIKLLMQNENPVLFCKSCSKKAANLICSQCRDTICENCTKRHRCVVNEGDDYMLLPLVNSPRTGCCGYGAS